MMETDDSLKKILSKTADGHELDSAEAEKAFELIMSGKATPAQIGAFLMALRVRGETVTEIAAAAKVMRIKANKIRAPENAIDIVGTGGDGSGSLNISTGAALVVAGCGVPVAKHGNRALSSRAGSADVLTSLGVNIDCEMPLIEKAIDQARVGFMMAPRHHSATRHVAGPRVELGTRTIFNLLGPLSNPAGVKRLLIGVYAKEWIRPMAEVVASLGAEKAWVVHGSDGLDEMTTTGSTYVAAYENGDIKTFECSPEEAGIEKTSAEKLKGGDAAYNANALLAVLNGERVPYRDIVCYTAAAGLIIADKVKDLKMGIEMARESIDRGQAKAVLENVVSISNEKGTPGI